jgi:hypothetical protein
MLIELSPKYIEAIMGTGIRLGVPMLDRRAALEENFFQITVPREPHIFFVEKLRLSDDGAVTHELPQVLVMLGHATVSGNSLENWKFIGTGQSVDDTVRHYEQAASLFSFPPLDVILACRDESGVLQSNVKVIFSRRKYPYIVPADGRIVISNYSSVEKMSWVVPGNGVGILQASAQSWAGIDRWKRFWDGDDSKCNYHIPPWAKSPRY